MEAEEYKEETTDKQTGGDLHLIRCSRGISTGEIERGKFIDELRPHHSRPTEIALDDSSPPSSSTSDKASAGGGGGILIGCASFRFEDSEPAAEPGQTRNSILLQLISCGTIAVKGGRAAAGIFLNSTATAPAGRKSEVAVATAEMHCMSEKEYFSGSIMEGIAMSSRAADSRSRH